MPSGTHYNPPIYTEGESQHVYYGSTIDVSTTVLIEDAIREAKAWYGGDNWELVEIDEYHGVVYDDDDDDQIIDQEARVVVRRVS